jgi:pyruvate/2-oxoglutarate dehydrogenase complex dihydrolipoamide dehydrogenase (E3) component
MHKYDVAIIGGGAGGLVVASVAAQLGLRVALVEKEQQLGGDCLHYGCVPSKALLRAAHVAHTAANADDYGLSVVNTETDMGRINAYINRAVTTIQRHDSHQRFRELGCDIYTGKAVFADTHHVQAGDAEISAKRFVIATGSLASIPGIAGLREVGYLTNEDMFSLEALPEHLLVLGGGPVGVEMAQAYVRLGSRVTLIELADYILPRFDRDISQVIKEQLLLDGINIVHGVVDRVSQQQAVKTVLMEDGRKISGDCLLVAIGRSPVVSELGLDKAGVDYDEQGIRVNRGFGSMRECRHRSVISMHVAM